MVEKQRSAEEVKENSSEKQERNMRTISQRPRKENFEVQIRSLQLYQQRMKSKKNVFANKSEMFHSISERVRAQGSVQAINLDFLNFGSERKESNGKIT